jgi:hypothetical protein
MSKLHLAAVLALSPIAVAPAQAQEPATYEITLKDRAFTPAELKVPAGQAFMIKLNNVNAVPAEFESHDLNIEKIAAGNSSIVVKVKALKPGRHLFHDEIQEDVAKGYVIAE